MEQQIDKMEIKKKTGFGNQSIKSIEYFGIEEVQGIYTTWELWHDGKFQLTTSAIVPMGKEKEYDEDIRNKLIDKWKKQ